MRIERRYTKDGQSAYADIKFRTTTSEIRNPDGSVVFKLDNVEVPEFWSQVASDVLAQKYFRKAGVPARLKKVEENTVPSFLWRSVADEAALARAAREGTHRRRTDLAAGVRSPGRHLDLLGLEGRLFRHRERRAGLLRRAALHAGRADVRAQFAAMVQHRPALGLRHRRPQPGPFLRRSVQRGADQVDLGLRAPAAARLLHPVRLRRPGQRRRHHGSVGARGAPVQIRLGHRLELLQAARRRRETVGRRQVVRPDVLPQDRRPRRGRHQVRRHHAARRQDGDRRRRSPGYRDLYRLEGDGRAEGGGARHRLQDQPEAPQGRAQGLRQLRGLGRRLLLAGEKPRAQARDQAGAPLDGAGQLHQARHPVRQAGLQGHQFPDLRHRLGLGSLSHRRRAELEQFGARHRRLPARGRGRRQMGPDLPQERQGREDGRRPRSVGEDRPRRLGLGRSGPAIPHHGQRLAHLPGRRRNPRLQSVLGIHVPRRHRLQSRLAEPADLPRRRDRPVPDRELRARRAAVDRGAGNLGDDGAVPVEGNRGALLRIPHARPRLRQYRRPADDRGHRL